MGGRSFFLFILTVFTTSALHAESVLSALSIHDGINQAFEKRRALNRAETEFRWDQLGGIVFPCAEEMEKARAAGKLPSLVLHGELHDAPISQTRRQLLDNARRNPAARWGLVVEDYNENEPATSPKDGISGLEHELPKELNMLMFIYEDLSNRAAAAARGQKVADAYGQSFLLTSTTKDPVRELWRNNHAELSALLKGHPDTLAMLEEMFRSPFDPSKSAARLAHLHAQHTVLLPVVRRLIELMVKKVDAEMKQGLLDGEAVPQELHLEVAYALRDMDRLAQQPNSISATKAKEKRMAYLSSAWRERHMARILARAYCDNLKSATPRPSLHAIMGQRHVDGVGKLLAANATAHGLPISANNGEMLAQAEKLLVGTADPKTGSYPDQRLVLEKMDGRPLALSKQADGLRVTVLMGSWDPLPGSPLNRPLSVNVFGDLSGLRKRLGLAPTAPIPGAEFNKLGQALVDEFEGRP